MSLKNILALDQLNSDVLNNILDKSVSLSKAFKAKTITKSLKGKRIALVNDLGGWRNTSAIDIGAQMLGAECTHVPITLSGQEDIADLGKYLSNWFDLIAIRSHSLKNMSKLAAAASIPVLNLRTNDNHPCEILGDLSFAKEMKKNLNGLQVVAVGAASNIIHSWAEVTSILPISLTQISPKNYWVDENLYPSLNIHRTDKIEKINNADIIITDCWPNNAVKEQFLPHQITTDLLNTLKPNCLFIPCPPVTRGEEVTSNAMGHPLCVATEAKAHLLHVQNACLEVLLQI